MRGSAILYVFRGTMGMIRGVGSVPRSVGIVLVILRLLVIAVKKNILLRIGDVPLVMKHVRIVLILKINV